MNVYVISYDLISPGQKYDKIKDAIDKLSVNWCRPLESFYLVKSNYSSEHIFNTLHSLLDSNDLIFVIEVKNNKFGWLHKDQWNYIDTHIF